MDVAALNLAVDSSSVVTAANDLDRFSTVAAKAAAAGKSLALGAQAGSIAKLVAEVQSANTKLTVIVGTLEKLALADKSATAANDNLSRSYGNADAHVVAYREHLAGLVAAQNQASSAMVAADAHVVAYQAHLASLSAQQADANAHVLAWRDAVRAQGVVQGDANAHVLAYRDHLKGVADDADKAGKAIRFTAQDSLNASRQLADIGVTAASGMSPFLIAIQQGPQLLDILQNKAAMTGQTLGAVFRAAAASVLSFIAPFLPLIAILALAAAGIAALTKQANDDSGLKKYTTAMGYTKAEVAKLNAVTVTFGDTTRAVFQVGWQRIAEAFGFSTNAMSKTWSGFLNWLTTATRATVAGVYAAVLGAYDVGKNLVKDALKGDLSTETLTRGYKERYAQAQRFMTDVAKQAGANARSRQDQMAKGFYDAPKPDKAPKGPKPYTYDDLLKEAQKTQDGLTKAGAQIGLYGEDLARVTYEQDLFNKASEHSLRLTPQQTAHIKELAGSMAALSESNRHGQFMEAFNQQTLQQVASLEQTREAIGLNGAALVSYTYELEQLNKAQADHIKLTDADRAKISDDAARIGDASYGNTLEQARSDRYRAHNETMRQLDAERGGLYLTGQALVSYQYQQELITRALSAGVQFKDLDTAAIRRQGDAYAAQRYDIDQNAKALGDAREVTRGFFSDWINGAREGGNIFKTFADSAVNALNRVIDKLLDKTLDTFLDSIFQGNGQGGGFFSSLFGRKAATPAPATGTPRITVNALGGVYGSPTRFANGGAFTNSIVTSLTLFRFANGGALGEMGEAGPEAIMPLKRGPNGALGVQAHGGGRTTVRMGDVHNTYQVSGALDQNQIVAMVRQGGEATYNQVKRDLQSLLQQLDTDGAFAS